MATKNRKRRGRGEGGIRLRHGGWWEGRISLGFSPNGKRRRKFVYARTKAGLLTKLDRARGGLAAGPPPDAASVTVGQLLDRWLAVKREKNSARTIEEWERLIKNHIRPRVGNVKLAGLSAHNVDFLILGMCSERAGAWTVRHAMDLLSMACRYGVAKRLLRSNPCDGCDKPTPARREIHPLTASQVKALLSAAAGKPVYALLAAALGTGARMGELLGLARRDVDLKAGTVTIRKALSKAGYVVKEPKTKAGRRTISLPPFARDALAAHWAAGVGSGSASVVFGIRTGGYLDKKNVRRAFRAVLARANKTIADAGSGDDGPAPIPDSVRWHDLRHTHASLLLSSGH